jgi:hypothetical protein
MSDQNSKDPEEQHQADRELAETIAEVLKEIEGSNTNSGM